MPPALRKRPISPASAAATLTHPTHLPSATVAPQPSTDARRKTAVSR